MSARIFPNLAVLGNEFIPDLCLDLYPRKGVWHRQLQKVQPEVGIADLSSCLLLSLEPARSSASPGIPGALIPSLGLALLCH